MTPDPHQQGCDTCRYKSIPDGFMGSTYLYSCDACEVMLSETDVQLIVKIGCASHSAAPAAAPVPAGPNSVLCKFCQDTLKEHDEFVRQQAAAKERGRVLDALIQWCSDNIESARRMGKADDPATVQYCHMWNKCESLRGEQPGQAGERR